MKNQDKNSRVDNFSSRLSRAISASGLKQKELAKIVGIAEITLSRYKSGVQVPNKATLNMLASVLNVSPTWLSEGKEKTAESPKSSENTPTQINHFLLNLRFLINKTELQDQEIADRLGIHKVSLSRYFTERRIPKRTVLEKIATYFNLSSADLLERDLTAKADTPPAPPKLSGILNLTDDVPVEFQKEVEIKLTALQQQINNTVCDLLNKFAELKKQ